MCIDIARDAVKMMDQGKSLALIRQEIDSKYNKASRKSSGIETGSDVKAL